MLIQLTPDQIAKYWGSIKPILQASLPPTEKASEEVMISLLEAGQTGAMRYWAIQGEEDKKIYGIAATTFIEDSRTKTKNLLIYALFGFAIIPDALWRGGLAVLRKYAKANNCSGIIGYTDNARVEQMAKQLGATISKVVRLEV